ncbi:glycosyltransferase family 4 protein [Calorimonas adulescens]|uniref:Glycosyltransferase n=1 Tax=Calorimonas adulescens TaxID=2606906 RepID=A0A5D8QE29_9THEO|nr:glycosyltransferase family 4 protein [Calorimonas adulescens]TZE82434.1 glycosyltransferase [Calorimonas adulescens]
MNIAILSTYPPRECGIASFSKDLRDNFVKMGKNVKLLAITDSGASYNYPPEVIFEINQDERDEFIKAAHFVNDSFIDVVIVEHEYGIFGGLDGKYVLDFAAHLRKPFILTTHTVLPSPNFRQKWILRGLGSAAAAVACMTGRSASLLEDIYGVPKDKIYVIPHGVPSFKQKNREQLKSMYGYSKRTIVSTFGLIGPGKGIENGIKAIGEVASRHPEILYLVLGETHPSLVKKFGETYRESLIDLVEHMHLTDNVQFVNHYLSLDELGDYLYMTDVYMTPYPDKNQAVSGTLTYAVGCGRAIVSTPYEYALEILGNGRGLIAKSSNNYMELATLIENIIDNPTLKHSLEERASKLGKTMTWTSVAKQYINLMGLVIQNSARGNGYGSVLQAP